MGDRVDVTFTVRHEDAKRAVDLLNTLGWNTEIYQEVGEFSEIILSEVNYADIDDEAALLRDAGIPFEADWYPGCNFSSGTVWVRFTEDGKALHGEFHDEERTVANYAKSLLNAIESGEDLIGVQTRLEKACDEVSIPTWDNQDEYAKRFMLKNIVESK